MPRYLHPDTVTALSESHQKWLILIDLYLDSITIRLCTRFLQFVHQGQVYTGIGNVSEIGSIDESLALDPTSCNLILSAIDPALLSTIANSDLLNRQIKIQCALLDENNAVRGEPILYFEGAMDMPDITFGKDSMIDIDAKGALADWDRNRPERLTHEDQLSRYPSDKGLEFIASIGSKEIVWPSKGFRE